MTTTNRRKPTPRAGGSDTGSNSSNKPPESIPNHEKTETIPAIGGDGGSEGATPALSMLPKPHAIAFKPPSALDLLDPAKKDEIPDKFETSKLTPEMLYEVIADRLDNTFARTPAGYISIRTAITEDGEPMIAVLHWKSYNFPEEDTAQQAVLRFGAMVDIDV